MSQLRGLGRAPPRPEPTSRLAFLQHAWGSQEFIGGGGGGGELRHRGNGQVPKDAFCHPENQQDILQMKRSWLNIFLQAP